MTKPYVPPLVQYLLAKAGASVAGWDPIDRLEALSALKYIVRAVEAYGGDCDKS